ncbi:MAG: DUF4375 domain-containing protein [Candidatus Hydrogenedentes bacterium]|nr:DUF4375 domain-containing protein [Candidatus Hydrogenedentota bacterium]
MNDLEWLDGYSGESTDELLGLEGKFRTDSLAVAFEEALDQKSVRVGAENLTEEERIVLAVEALEREVNNGGYSQFLLNASDEYAPMIVRALNRIGRDEVAALTQDAIDALGIAGSVTAEAVDAAMAEEDEQRDAKLNACDEKYYAVAGDLAGALIEFIKSNRSAIRLTE